MSLTTVSYDGLGISNALHHYTRGMMLVESASPSLAISEFSTAIGLFPKESLLSHDLMWNSYVQRANCFFSLRQFEKCLGDCSEVIGLIGSHPNLLAKDILDVATHLQQLCLETDNHTQSTTALTVDSSHDIVLLSSRECKRCKSVLMADSSFCGMCGLAVGKVKRKVVESSAQRRVKHAAVDYAQSPKKSTKKSGGQVTGNKRDRSSALTHSLSLPHIKSNILSSSAIVESDEAADPVAVSLRQLVAATTASEEEVSQVRDMLRRTNQMEQRNSQLIEASYNALLHEKQLSSAVSQSSTLSAESTSRVFQLPHIKSVASSTSSKSKSKKRRERPAVLVDNYLDSVGSVGDHFKEYVSRVHEYQGLRSAARERLVPLEKRPLNEVLLSEGPSEFSSSLRPVSRLRSPSLTTSQLPSSGTTLVDNDGISAAAANEEQDIQEGVDYEPQSFHSGSAFLWGPIFDNTEDFTVSGSLETVQQLESEARQYSLRGDFEVSESDPLLLKVTGAEQRERNADSRDILFWGDIIHDNQPAESSEAISGAEAPFDEEYLVSRLLRWNQGYADSVTPPDTESDSESEDEVIDLCVNEPDTLTEKYAAQQNEINLLTSEQMSLQKELPALSYAELNIVEDLESRHANDREEYASKDESLVVSIKGDLVALNEARDSIFLNRKTKMDRFERQMRRDIRHAKRNLRKFERQKWKETMKASTQLYIQSVLTSGEGGDSSLMAALPDAVPHEAIYDLMDDKMDDDEEVEEQQQQQPLSSTGLCVSPVRGGVQYIDAQTDSRSPSKQQQEGCDALDVVSKQMLRLADKLTHSNDEALLIRIEDTRRVNRVSEEQRDLEAVHTVDQVQLKVAQTERELTEMQRRVDMLNIEKLIDADRLVDHPDKLDEEGLKDLTLLLNDKIKQQTADQLELTSAPHNLTDDEQYIYRIEQNMLTIRLITEDLDYQNTIMNTQVRMNNNLRDRDIHELTRKIGAIRAENVLKLDYFNQMVAEREAKRQAERIRESQLLSPHKTVNRTNSRKSKRNTSNASIETGESSLSNDEVVSNSFDPLQSAPRDNEPSEFDDRLNSSRSEQPEEQQQQTVEAEVVEVERASIFLDETVEEQRVALLEERDQRLRAALEESEDSSLLHMQQTLNAFEASREQIGVQRSSQGQYFDIGSRSPPLNEAELFQRSLQGKSTQQLSQDLTTMDLVKFSEAIELVDTLIAGIKDSVERLDTDLINETFTTFNSLQFHRDETEKRKVTIREVEEGRAERQDDLEGQEKDAQEEFSGVEVPLSMIRDAAEVVQREMSLVLNRNKSERDDQQLLLKLASHFRAGDEERLMTSASRSTLVRDIDEGTLVEEPAPAAPQRVRLSVEQMSAEYGDDFLRPLDDLEVEDRNKQAQLTSLAISDHGALVQSLEDSHSLHRDIFCSADTEQLFSAHSDILYAHEASLSIEQKRRIEAVEQELQLVIGDPSVFAGHSNLELSRLHIAKDSAKLELLEKTLVFKRSIEDARDAFALRDNQEMLSAGQNMRDSVHALREEQLRLTELDMLAENAMIEERIEAQAKMKRKNKLKEAILYNSTVVDPAVAVVSNAQFSIETALRNVLVTDELSLDMKVEHAEAIQREQQELDDLQHLNQLTDRFKQLELHWDEQAFQRQITAEHLHEEAGIALNDEEEEQQQAEAAVDEVVSEEVVVKPYISRRRQRREAALNRAVPERITVETKVEEQEEVERERLVLVSEAQLAAYFTKRRRELHVTNNVMAIKKLYAQSIDRLKRTLIDLQIDFKADPSTANIKLLVASARNSLMSGYDILEDATKVNAFVHAEYSMFHEQLNHKRALASIELSNALAAASQTEHSLREKYAAAAREFKQSVDTNEFSFVSDTGKHIVSNDKMDAIKAQAQAEMNRSGLLIKRLQAKEAQLVLNLKQEEFVVQEIIKKWHPKHCEAMDSASEAYRRLEGWLRDNLAAGKK